MARTAALRRHAGYGDRDSQYYQIDEKTWTALPSATLKIGYMDLAYAPIWVKTALCWPFMVKISF